MRARYNTEFKRWEVFGGRSVERNGEKQPVFVSTDAKEVVRYMIAVARMEERR